MSELKKKTIGVLMGGLSAEREVSLKSGKAVLDALIERDHNAVALQVDETLDVLLRAQKVDVVFNALHGRYGEDGCVQGLLEMMRIPYTGSGVLASALSMNKVKAKELFRLHNLPTPPYYIIDRGSRDFIADVHGSFGFPVVVKPCSEGSSIGVSVAHDHEELAAACARAFELDDALLVERYIVGKEVHVGIVNGRALGAIGIVPQGDIFDYQAKYTPGHAHYHLPAKLSRERYRGVLTQALRAHRALGCSGATRVDMIVSDLGNEYILEVNTNPGLTKLSLLPRIAQHAGLSYADLAERILEGAKLHGTGADASAPERRVAQRGFSGGERRRRRAANY